MAFLAPLPSTQSLLRTSLSSHETKAGAACRRPSLAKPFFAESKRSKTVVPLATKVASSEVGNNIVGEDYEKLAKELETSPFQIMEKALDKFGNDISIVLSGADDVALIEYAKLTGQHFKVFSLDTGRLNPETYQFFKTVEKYYGIHIEYMFPDAIEVQVQPS